MNLKLFLATIAGAIIAFFFGWLVYGVMLMDFFTANTIHYEGLMMEMPNIFLLALGYLAISFFMAFVFQRWAAFTTFMSGLYGGLVIGFFFSFTFDLYIMAGMNLYTPTSTIVDIVVNTVIYGITGGVIAFILGLKKEKEPASQG